MAPLLPSLMAQLDQNELADRALMPTSTSTVSNGMGPKSLRSGLIVLALAVALSVMIPSLAPTRVSFNAFCFIRKFGLAHWLRPPPYG